MSLILLAALTNPCPAQPRQAGEVRLTLDPAEVAVGGEVRLHETVPDPMPVRVYSVGHAAVRVGRFDTQSLRLINLPAGEAVTLGLDRLFPGLPFSAVGFHGLPLDRRADGRKGLTYTFRPAVPGVYVLSAEWHGRGGTSLPTGPPVLLTVRPAPP